MICQQIIQRHNFESKASPEQLEKFKNVKVNLGMEISPEKAEEFYHNTNVMKFIRKTILFNDQQTFKSGLEEYLEECEQLTPDHPAYFSIENYKPEVQDL